MRARFLTLLSLVAACGSPGSETLDGGDGDAATDGVEVDAEAPRVIHTIFVIPFENKASKQIYGNTTDAPYINMLIATKAAHATKFGDELPSLPSEPHYVWMEAGTNKFTDKTFTTDSDSSTSNSTASTDHLVTKLTAAGIPWMSYQQGITSNTCPISSSGHYVAKHDPFVFFKDVAGSPPSKTNALCAAHHKSYADFPADLAAGLTGYVFITPDVCNDMHGALDCPSLILDSSNIQAGDTFLMNELPRIIAYTEAHSDAVIFLTWDEGDATNLIPFLAIGNYVKPAYESTVMYTHSSLLASVQKLLGVPLSSTVTTSTDFSDMFLPGVVFH